MRNHIVPYLFVFVIGISVFYSSCSVQNNLARTEKRTTPDSYAGTKDSINSATISWKTFFKDQNLIALIDSALVNNQELNILLQEIAISKNEIRARKGEYLPFVDVGGGAGVEKSGRYTRNGAVDATTEIDPGKENPDPLPNYLIGFDASWEVDIWKKLRNAKKSAMYRYLATTEGRNFMVTNLVTEISSAYYELQALDNQLELLKNIIDIQKNALEIIKAEKAAAKVSELAVRKFEAEVFKNQSAQYFIMQKIVETENKINFLVGRFPQPVVRNSATLMENAPDTLQAGIPSQLLENRTDIRQAEMELIASKLDVKVARANFYPSFRINAGLGFEAFNPKFIIKTPESMLYSLAGNLAAPLINRNAIKAFYYSANAKQIQAAYNYERTILNGYIEVVNQFSNINNLQKSYDLKKAQVEALTRSVDISIGLFKAARADYMEVLLTQRDALESRFELIETRKMQMIATVNMYRALGGGWK